MLDQTTTSGDAGEDERLLLAACESDRVAASRAVAQNAKLKEQVEELEAAVVKLVSPRAISASSSSAYANEPL